MKDTKQLYDVIVIGGGPAGLTAALYLARARYRVLVLEKEQFGGQITITHQVVNYPGIPEISGSALTENMRKQAEAFGAELLLSEVTAVEMEGDLKTVRTGRGVFQCFGILIATGAHPRRVGFEGEEMYRGRGVAYCATCDGEFFTGKEVLVVGGGFAAAEESVFLTRFARHVTILMRGRDFSCAEGVAEAARRNEKITILPQTVLESVSGQEGLTYARWRNTATEEVTELRTTEEDSFGVFVFAGYEPATEFLKDLLELDEHGYVVTDAACRTSREGIYAAGDVCIKPLRQVVTATGDGALAAAELEKYAAAMQRRMGLRPQRPALPSTETSTIAQGSSLLPDEMQKQLQPLLNCMENPLQLRLLLDHRPISRELSSLMGALADMADKLTIQEEASREDEAPCVQVCRADGTWTGLSFHGVPGGHEFTSFVLGLYNAAGPGQPLDEETKRDILSIRTPLHMKILVSLSCTMCPELVTAAQHMAVLNPMITAQVYDVKHFEALRKKYRVMSVPCLVINDEQVLFGKKTLPQLLEIVAAPG